MEIWEIISTILGSNVAVAVTTWFTTRKSVQIKNASDKDDVLLKRIDFLDKRISKLEQNACFQKDCEKRI